MNLTYDDIGTNYSVTRCTDPKIANQLFVELEDAARIVNIGAGTGSYEPENAELVAIEPSMEMISQRKGDAHRAVMAVAESLPFENNSFSHAMTILSMHHWKNRDLAFSEINRVATEKFVAITWDPQSDPFWLTRDYFPQIFETDKGIFPGMEELNKHFDEVTISPLKIPSDCKDGLLAAFWKRPEAYLGNEIRKSMSSFSIMENPSPGLQKLADDLASDAWVENNRAILELSSLDVGYRLISARIRNA